jgi:hypothetical protein
VTGKGRCVRWSNDRSRCLKRETAAQKARNDAKAAIEVKPSRRAKCLRRSRRTGECVLWDVDAARDAARLGGVSKKRARKRHKSASTRRKSKCLRWSKGRKRCLKRA